MSVAAAAVRPTRPHGELETYTARELAAELRVSERTMLEWLRTGVVRGFKLPGGEWRVLRTVAAATVRAWAEHDQPRGR